MKLLLAILLLNTAACAHPPVNKCTFICRSNNIPADCYCLEEEITKEAAKLEK